ncbi:MAG: DUF4271 domain-containing protein [Bacteroidales bacterium]|nr:DUF4271 domain-containing protein [Bacteroidales bacterium]
MEYTLQDVSPSAHIINKKSWSSRLEEELKSNILFKQTQKDSLEGEQIYPSQLIVQQKIDYNEGKLLEKQFDWFFIFFILLFSLLALIKVLSLKSLYNKFYSIPLSIENNFFNSGALLFIIMYIGIGMGLILYSFLGYLLPIKNELLKILFFIGGFSSWMLLKSMIYIFSGVLFKIKDQTQQYFQNIIVINYYIIVFLFPIALIYHYYPFDFLIYLFFILWGLAHLYRIGLGFFIFKSKFYIYENFLYFCTIEFLPLLLGMKISLNYV